MRNIPFTHTTPQFKARAKTVTRRLRWRFLKVGEVLCAVEKSRGLRRGEKLVRLDRIKVTDVRREPLRRMLDDLDYGLAETTREGFPSGDPLHSPSEFVEFFCRTHKGCTPHSEVTRIEWNSRDSEAFSRLFTPDGEYIDPSFGIRRTGRSLFRMRHRTAGQAKPRNSPYECGGRAGISAQRGRRGGLKQPEPGFLCRAAQTESRA